MVAAIMLVVAVIVGICLWLFVFSKDGDTKDTTETPATEFVTDTPAETDTTTAVAQPQVEEPAYSTTATPTDADFSSWYIGNAQTKGKPSSATAITDLAVVKGSWKALFYQDPKNKYGVKAYSYANVTIGGDAADLTYTIKRHSTKFLSSNEIINEEDELDDVFNAKWNNGKLTASGAGSVTITAFWEQNGKQYAVGTFDSPDGMPVSIGMVRP